MNTVSHPDGTAFSATGRHLAGGTAPASSVDVAIANELGTEQLLPDVAIGFPASYVGERLDRRAIPLRVPSAATIAKSLARGDAYLHDDDRAAITALLTDEAHALAGRSTYPETYERLASQEDSLPHLLGNELKNAFTQKALTDAYPGFDYKAKNIGNGALGAAFAIEAMKRNLVRCVGFALGGLDTHNQNYKQHAHTQQELFGAIATLVKLLDATPHPTKRSAKLSEHTHILVFSDFCRTPQINLSGGRDHYPNNSALVISPRFRAGRAFGKTDDEQLLPADAGLVFSDGPRPIAPPDLLATCLHAFGIDPRRYLRDGEVVKEMLAVKCAPARCCSRRCGAAPKSAPVPATCRPRRSLRDRSRRADRRGRGDTDLSVRARQDRDRPQRARGHDGGGARQRRARDVTGRVRPRSPRSMVRAGGSSRRGPDRCGGCCRRASSNGSAIGSGSATSASSRSSRPARRSRSGSTMRSRSRPTALTSRVIRCPASSRSRPAGSPSRPITRSRSGISRAARASASRSSTARVPRPSGSSLIGDRGLWIEDHGKLAAIQRPRGAADRGDGRRRRDVGARAATRCSRSAITRSCAPPPVDRR